MSISPEMLGSLTASATFLGLEFLKGGLNEAGKNAWLAIRHVFGWKSDPSEAELERTVSGALASSPEIAEKVDEIVKAWKVGAPPPMVGKITNNGGTINMVSQVIGGQIKFGR